MRLGKVWCGLAGIYKGHSTGDGERRGPRNEDTREKVLSSYLAEGDGSGREAYEATVSSMWLMNCVGKFIAKLLYDSLDLLILPARDTLMDYAF